MNNNLINIFTITMLAVFFMLVAQMCERCNRPPATINCSQCPGTVQTDTIRDTVIVTVQYNPTPVPVTSSNRPAPAPDTTSPIDSFVDTDITDSIRRYTLPYRDSLISIDGHVQVRGIIDSYGFTYQIKPRQLEVPTEIITVTNTITRDLRNIYATAKVGTTNDISSPFSLSAGLLYTHKNAGAGIAYDFSRGNLEATFALRLFAF